MSAETALSKRIREALTKSGFTVFRVHSGMKKVGTHWMHFAPKGTPDLCGHAKGGVALYVEVKDEAELTPEQREFLRKAVDDGAYAGVARSVDEAIAIANGKRRYQATD